jgi:phosphoglycerol transferase MdoB-like AlkP superfamily enzyme
MFRTCEYMPTFCRLRDTGLAGQVNVPTFGGLTTRTEFEILTGVSLRPFEQHTHPYFSLVTAPRPSLATRLKRLGYQTVFSHPNYRTFWNRQSAVPLLGFDLFADIRGFENSDREGIYVSDRALTTRVLRRLDEPDNQPIFVFAVSMENHGPWGHGRPNIDPDLMARVTVPSELADNAGSEWREYAYHLMTADRELARLHEAITDSKHPTILAFFGDHWPSLPATYEALAFNLQDSEVKSKTPFLMIRNYGESNAARKEISASEFANELLEFAQLCVDRYCTAHRSLRASDDYDKTKLELLQLAHFYERL